MFKKIIKILLILIIVLVVFLFVIWRIYRSYFYPYIPHYKDEIHLVMTTYKFTIPQDQKSCEAKGGIWKKIGIRPMEECNLPTTDGGKSCWGSNVCEGVCLAELSREDLQKGMKGKMFKREGKCSEWVKVVGCRAYVYQGWASVVCSD
jgi:hypothetical protein